MKNTLFCSIFSLHMKGHNESTPPMHHVEYMVCEKKHVFDYVYVRYNKSLQLKALCFMLFMTSDTRITRRFACNLQWNNSSIWCFLQFHLFASIVVFLRLQFSCNLQKKIYKRKFSCYDCNWSCSVMCERIDASDVKEDAHFQSTSLFTLFKFKSL
jgi:hypothetical protein